MFGLYKEYQSHGVQKAAKLTNLHRAERGKPVVMQVRDTLKSERHHAERRQEYITGCIESYDLLERVLT